MGPWFTALVSAESATMLAFVAVVLLVYLTTRVHLEPKQNAMEHAELRRASERQAEEIARLRESTDRRFDSTDRKLDQILGYLLRNRSDRDD